MSELTVSVLRLALLAALWLFVLAVARVLRSDLYGARVVTRDRRRQTRRTPMPDEASPDRPGRRNAPREPRRLVVVAGPMRGASLALTSSPVVIGRNPESSLSVDDDSISGSHARISPDPHGWIIEDLGSTNGTWLDDQRLLEAAPLVVGSTIRLGRTVLEAKA
ncbi:MULTISPECIES: FHA domain-containing protein [Kytococcus]|uniref:FHA domain-containing protein n=1 Tax=Kytococcus schroeteri TaxID=138300 RepID=A0A2I1PCR0_9MICO|nr:MULTISPECIES: FHA domain-containing protein [Kytococcus]OFS06539.1 hypothetical protein HMPREF3099_10990 [Kytococcus sp. HMSC28H12]PKZ42422.1 FHA domain-containing protein [Kytococcus schroeteri]